MTLDEFCTHLQDRVGWAFETEEDGSAFFYVDVAPDTIVRAHLSSQIMSDDLDHLDELGSAALVDLVDSFVGSIVAEVEYLVSVGRIRGRFGDVELFAGGSS